MVIIVNTKNPVTTLLQTSNVICCKVPGRFAANLSSVLQQNTLEVCSGYKISPTVYSGSGTDEAASQELCKKEKFGTGNIITEEK